MSCAPLWTSCSGADEPEKDCAFDRAAWATDPVRGADSYGPTPRQREADELIACGTLDGAHRDEVAALLGEPGPEMSPNRLWAYLLGPDRGYGVDYEELVIEFGPDGAATQVFVRQG